MHHNVHLWYEYEWRISLSFLCFPASTPLLESSARRCNREPMPFTIAICVLTYMCISGNAIIEGVIAAVDGANMSCLQVGP